MDRMPPIVIWEVAEMLARIVAAADRTQIATAGEKSREPSLKKLNLWNRFKNGSQILLRYHANFETASPGIHVIKIRIKQRKE